MSLQLLFGALGAVGVLIVVMGLAANRQPETELHMDSFNPAAAAATKRGSFLETILEGFNKSLTRRGGRSSKLTEDLAKADLKLRVSEYVVLVVGLILLLCLVLLLRFHNPILMLIGIPVGYFAPGFFIKFRQRRRLKAFNNQLGDTIVLLSNALKAGYSFAQAMATIAKSASPPMADEFSRAVREMNLGVSVDDALQHMVKRIESEDFDLMVTAVQIHRVVGGNLAEILDTIAFTIRERIRIQGEIRTLTAQARASGYIITGLPFALALLLTFISPSYITPLFHEWLGYVLIGMGLVSIAIGYGIISKITNIQV
ncbi:MAG TPA: type II secretion system F family protein [Candidatus Limnocylindrales bacterium]|nr:type II secretion system F family protein [Candidatus Limnocylindrales bacterium]